MMISLDSDDYMQNVDNHIERLVGKDYNYDDDYDKDINDDIYIMMQCLCVCLSQKIITSELSVGGAK